MDLVEVVAGRGPAPSLVLALIEGLPDDSMTRASMSGGIDFLGWGMERHLLAAIYDALNLNTRTTGNWEKGKAPQFDPWPRPGSEKKKKKVTVADLFNRLKPKGGFRA